MRAPSKRLSYKSGIVAHIVAFTVLGLFLLLSFADPAGADTPVSGPMASDTTWTAANSPYIVTDNILVNSGVTLTIQPGVTIKFNSGRSWQIDGTLVARGTEQNKIVFTSNLPAPAPGDWGYLLLNDLSPDATYAQDGSYTGGSILEYVIVEYAGGVTVGSYNGALRLNNTHPFVNHATIRNNAQSGIVAWGLTGTLKIMNSFFTNNTSTEGGGGLRIYNASSGTAVLINNTVKSNSTAGAGGGIDARSGVVTISGNTVSDNQSSSYGGGVYIYSVAATVSDNFIRNNTGSGGGGLYVMSTATVSSNVVVNNRATVNYGGGIYADEGGSWIAYPVVVSENILSGNSAAVSGGGLSVFLSQGGTMAIQPISANTISGNMAPNFPGIYVAGGNSYINNTITRNTATGTGPTSTMYDTGTFSFFNYNNIFNNTATYELWNGNAQGKDAIDSTNNWWGTAYEPEIQAKIYDYLDDSTKGLVNYSPYDTAIRTDTPMSPPTGVVVTASSDSIDLTWYPNPESTRVAGYKVYWGQTSGSPYANMVDVGKVTHHTITGLGFGKYYVAVTAYDASTSTIADDPNTPVNEKQTSGHESWYSDEMVAIVHGPPATAITNAASGITAVGATLNGTVNANGDTTTVTFQYGLTTAYGSTVTAGQSPVSGTSDTAVSQAITGLTPNTTYHYRVLAANLAGTIYGDDMPFTTTAIAPMATTNPAGGITATGATVKGTVNAHNASTAVTFQCGLTIDYGSPVTADQSPVTGTSDTAVSKALTGLAPNTTYHCRVVAVNSAGTTYGSDMIFTTSTLPPTAKTNPATGVTSAGATLNGTVNTNNANTTVTFQYGLTTSYGTTVTADQSPVTGASDIAVSKVITGLTSNTLYHYRVVATNSSGTVNGSDGTFKTLANTIPPPNSAFRNLPNHYEPGQPATVIISVTPASSTKSHSVEDIVPAGWTVSDISNSGLWNAPENKVDWGPFLDANTRTLTYKATPPVGEKGTKTFSGTASFDGSNQPITGEANISNGLSIYLPLIKRK